MSIVNVWQPGYVKRRAVLALSLVSFNSLILGSLANAQSAPDSAPPSETTWHLVDDFEGVQTSWRISLRESLRRVLTQQRTDQTSRSGLRSEYLAVLVGKGNERVYATHPIPPSMAIGEFGASVWLRGDRPGFQLMARVRLPRTLDANTGQAMSLIVAGDAYEAVGSWQRLTLHHIDRQVDDVTRALRADRGRHVDSAEAYVDLVVLNLYGGAGKNRVWVDDLMLTGVVPSRHAPTDAVQPNGVSADESRPRVQLQNRLVLVDNTAWMPRIVRYRGESFSLLKQLGFNCVWLIRPATDRQVAEARKHDLWIICPAPDQHVDLRNLDRVLAWCVGHDVTPDDFSDTLARSREIRLRDAYARPLVLSARDHHDDWSRLVDIVVDTRPNGVPRSRPGYPIWTSIFLNSNANDVSWFHVRDQTHMAIAHGYKGVVVSANENLGRSSSRFQRQLMELTNSEFELLQPWAIANEIDAVRETARPGGYAVTVLRNGHTQLALVHRYGQRAGPLATNPSTDVVIPASGGHAAFLIGSDRLSPLTPRRVAGGVRISLPATLRSARILFTDQPSVVRHITQYLQEHGPRVRQLLLEVARAEVLDLDQLISKAADTDTDQAALRTRIHGLHGLLPTSAVPANPDATADQLETVLLDVDNMRRQLRALKARSGDP